MSAAPVVIAIDGPAASGKSSVARLLAQRLGFIYVNTGAMYRAVTWHLLRHGVNLDDPSAVQAALAALRLDCGIEHRVSTLRLDGEDPTPHLSDADVAASVSTVSSLPAVRALLVAHQHEYAEQGDLVMEGRDIGTAVFPDTPYKFYIDASLDVRASRRSLQGFHDDLAHRDHTDSTRTTSPLQIAADALVIDSSALTIEAVVAQIISHLEAQGFEVG